MGCCNGHRWSSLLSLFSLLFGILGCGLWQGLKKEDNTGTSYIGIWTASAKVDGVDSGVGAAKIEGTGETHRGQYSCDDYLYLLSATAAEAPLVYDDLPDAYKTAVAEVSDVVGNDVLEDPVGDLDGKGRMRRGADGSGSTQTESLADFLGGTKCGIALKRRCKAGRVFSVWATLFSFIVIPFAMCAQHKKKWVVGFHFLAMLGFLVTCSVLGATYGGELDAESMKCGQGDEGEWKYGIAAILIMLAVVLEFVAMFIGWCFCKQEEDGEKVDG